MTTQVDLPTTGMERVEREALIVLLETVNDALPAQIALWEELDQHLADMRGIDYEPTNLEPIPAEHFHQGYKPSLINADIEEYPNIAVICDDAGPSGGREETDQIDNYGLRLIVEVMVKADDEELCNRRIKRTADAVNICMMSNPTLRGTIHGFESTPSINLSEVFLRKEETSYGPEWCWQGARIEYTVRKESQIPSGDFAFIASNSPSDPAGYDIDQE